jgi:hypothetical protein
MTLFWRRDQQKLNAETKKYKYIDLAYEQYKCLPDSMGCTACHDSCHFQSSSDLKIYLDFERRF